MQEFFRADMKKPYYSDTIVDICDRHHLSVDDIFEQVVVQFPDAGKSSIYRNVEKLADEGRLSKVVGIEGKGKKVLFEKTKKPHAHFICSNSGKIFDIEISPEEFQKIEVTHPLTNKKVRLSEFSGNDLSIDMKISGTL